MAGFMSEAELLAIRADVARSFEDVATRIRYVESDDELGQTVGFTINEGFAVSPDGIEPYTTADTLLVGIPDNGLTSFKAYIPGRINRTGKDAQGRPYGVGTNLDRQFSAAWGADIKVGDTLIINGASYRVSTVIDQGSNSIISQFSITMISEAE